MRLRGFTLVELLVVMTIGAILVAAAVPSFVWLMTTTRVSNGVNTLSAAFERARSEAIRRGTVVSVCRTLDPNPIPDDSGLVCTNNAGGGYAVGDWSAGWVIFEKRMGTAVDFFDWNGGAGDVVLQRERSVSPGASRLLMVSNVAGAAVAYNLFGSAALNPTPSFSIDYRDIATVPLSGASRCLVVWAVTGRVLIRKPTVGEAAAGAC